MVERKSKRDPLHITGEEVQLVFDLSAFEVRGLRIANNRASDRVRAEGRLAVLELRESMRSEFEKFAIDPSAGNWGRLRLSMMAYQAASEAEQRINNGMAGDRVCGTGVVMVDGGLFGKD